MIKRYLFFCIAITFVHFVQAQVGIGTDLPDVSSLLDVQSSEKGVLLPRMTTLQRNAIPEPANGLTVFDTDEQSYYFYNDNASGWESLSSSRLDRDNFVLVKSQEDFPAASGGTIVLDANTYYEINGTIALDTPIDMNGAYVGGKDSSNDILIKSTGNVFEGRGGNIKDITITGGGNVFNITSGSSLLIQNTIIANMSSVGTISGLSFLFSSNIQYANNTNGIVYKDIDSLLLNNQAWLASNTGILEKFEGNFDLLIKESGFSVANGNFAIDVSSNPTVGKGVIQGTVFSGTSTLYINKYTSTPSNLNFTKEWFVQAPGIPDEYDDIATANLYFDGTLTTGFSQQVNDNQPFKLTGSTVSTNLLRFASTGSNRLHYKGKNSRTFRVNASLSVRGLTLPDIFYSFYIRKNGITTLVETNSIFFVSSFTNVSSVSITGTVKLEPDDFIEIWGQRLTGSGTSNLVVFSQNLSVD